MSPCLRFIIVLSVDYLLYVMSTFVHESSSLMQHGLFVMYLLYVMIVSIHESLSLIHHIFRDLFAVRHKYIYF